MKRSQPSIAFLARQWTTCAWHVDISVDKSRLQWHAEEEVLTEIRHKISTEQPNCPGFCLELRT